MRHQNNCIAAALGLLMAAEAAICSAAAFAQSATGGAGLPADFPIPPGLSPCKPLVMSKEVICEWHNVDQHAMYAFFIAALPRAGYTVLPGAQEAKTATFYLAAIGFKKSGLQGAVTITGGKDMTIQVLSGQ